MTMEIYFMQDLIISGMVGGFVMYLVMKYKQKFIVEPTYAEFGRMSKLLWCYSWNFCKSETGSTIIYKEGENTTYMFSGDWMYKLLRKDRPQSERVQDHWLRVNKEG